MVDQDLLNDFVANANESAFGRIVERYSGLVFGAAMRCTRDRQLAEEAAQNVFLILARKAGKLEPGKLAGWLHRTAVLESRNLVRKESNTKRKEADMAEQDPAINENEPSNEVLEEMGPLLDEAISSLSSKEHTAVSLRFFDEKTYKDIGAVLGKSEEASRKLLTRTLEKLRRTLERKGVALSVTALASLLANDVAKAAAPIGLSQKFTSHILTEFSALTPPTMFPESAVLSNVPFYTGLAILSAAVISVAMMKSTDDRGFTIEDLIRFSKLASQTAFAKEMNQNNFKFYQVEGIPETYVYHSDKEYAASSDSAIQKPNRFAYRTENGQWRVELTTAKKEQFDPLNEQLTQGDLQFQPQSHEKHPVMEGSITTYASNSFPNIQIVVNETVMNENDKDGSVTSWDSYGIEVIYEGASRTR